MRTFCRYSYCLLLVALAGCNQTKTTETTTTVEADIDSTRLPADITAHSGDSTILGEADTRKTSRFLYLEHDAKMLAAIRMADSICALPVFWTDVEKYPTQKVDNSHFTMKMLADTLKNFNDPIKVRYLGGLHRANAITGPDGIKITKYGYSQDKGSLAVTLIHEWVHAVDYTLHPLSLQFAHYPGRQTNCKNKDTASYRVERVAENLLGNPDFALKCPH